MPTENEVKFILPKDFNEAALKDWEALSIRQGYLKGLPHIGKCPDGYNLSYTKWIEAEKQQIEIKVNIDEKDYEDLSSSTLNGYLSDGVVRLRQENDHYVFCYKQWHGEGTEKRLIEIETQLDKADFEALWPSTDNRLRKTRFIKHDGDIEWMADFLKDDNNETYFALAEAEMPEGMETPSRIPLEIKEHILFSPEKDNEDFTNKRLSDPQHARNMLNKIGTNLL